MKATLTWIVLGVVFYGTQVLVEILAPGTPFGAVIALVVVCWLHHVFGGSRARGVDPRRRANYAHWIAKGLGRRSRDPTIRAALEKWMSEDSRIGAMFEVDVGAWFEDQGFEVEYRGIMLGLQDGGVDLICRKGNQVVLVQCKCWGNYVLVDEDVVVRLRDATAACLAAGPGQHSPVTAMIVTTSDATEAARSMAANCGIQVVERYFPSGSPTRRV